MLTRRAFGGGRALAAAAAAPRCCACASPSPRLSTWEPLDDHEGLLTQAQPPPSSALQRRGGEHSVRRRKVAQAIEQQLRLLVHHPADIKKRDGRGGAHAAAATQALTAVALQRAEVSGDL